MSTAPQADAPAPVATAKPAPVTPEPAKAPVAEKPHAPAPAPAQPTSVFDAPAEPFELRAPNGTGPMSMASAVATALYARPRTAPFVAPEPAPANNGAAEKTGTDAIGKEAPADAASAVAEEEAGSVETPAIPPQDPLPLDLPPPLRDDA